MPTNHTPNYQLNQWEPEDKVLRTDFNADNVKIDAAIRAVEDCAASKADSSALDSLSRTVSSLAGTVTSQGNRLSAISQLGNCAVQIVTYPGDGATSKTVTFSGYPVFAIVRGLGGTGYMMFMRGTTTPLTPFSGTPDYPATWSNNSLTWSASTASGAMNSASSQYYVFALLDMSK